MNSNLARLFAVAALSAPLLVACSSDEDTNTDTDTGTDVPGDNGGDVTADTTTDGSGGTCAEPLPTHVATTYRVVSIAIAKPAGKGEFLANLMNTDFEAGILHILIDITEFESECGTSAFRITGNAGQVVSEGVYTWFDDVEVVYKNATMLEDGSITTDETLDLIFPAVEPGSNPPSIIQIPVREISIDGFVENTASGLVIDATLTGAILLEEARNVEIEIVPGSPSTVAELLGEDDIDYPIGAAEFTGWQLEAAIQAVPVTAQLAE